MKAILAAPKPSEIAAASLLSTADAAMDNTEKSAVEGSVARDPSLSVSRSQINKRATHERSKIANHRCHINYILYYLSKLYRM